MHGPFVALLTFSTIAFAACEPDVPMCYTQDGCERCVYLGPENVIANHSVRPVTCNGDISLTIAGLYWVAHQDGMEYALRNAVFVPVVNPSNTALGQMNHLIDSRYETANSDWDFGFCLRAGYNSFCDGWDAEWTWTHFQTTSHAQIEAEPEDNHVLVSLWSDFGTQHGNPLFARDIESRWKVAIDLVDLELGREFWVSRLLSFRPFIGLRYGSIAQSFDIEQKGGSWSPRSNGSPQDPFTNEIFLKNSFSGVGPKGGGNTRWHFGCGWSLYGNLGVSILYGRFRIDENEENRLAVSPHTKTKIMEIESHFKASRAILDLGIGVEWSALVCDCKYGVEVRLGWEDHLFFHQNQLWRVNRGGNVQMSGASPNNRGKTLHEQRRGTLDTQGLVLSFGIHL